MVWNREFPDIVQQSTGADRIDLVVAETEDTADADGIDLSSADVSDPDLVSSIDRRRESFDRCEVDPA